MQIIGIGGGRVGAGLAQSLSQRGHAVTVVDQEPVAFARLGARFTGHTVRGLCFDREVRRHAGIGRADGLAAVTGSDATHIVSARLARQECHVPRVVARL